MGVNDPSQWTEVWRMILAQDQWVVPPDPKAYWPVATCSRLDSLGTSRRLRCRMRDVEPEVAEAVLSGLWEALLGWGEHTSSGLVDRVRWLAERPYVVALAGEADRDGTSRRELWRVADQVRGTQAAWAAARGSSSSGPAALCPPVIAALDAGLPWVAERAFCELVRAFRPPPGDVFSALVADGTPMAVASRAAVLVV